MPIPQSPQFNFNDLFTFEMANNHQGSVAHGLKIIEAMATIATKTGVRAAVKLQFRDLDTFIHPAHRDSNTNKHIPRFLSTRLTEAQFGELVTAIKQSGLTSMATPFDEPSVAMVERLGVEIVKVGSCSAVDWPLLEVVAAVGKPVIFSTGGLTIKDIDRVVSFFQHRGTHFALQHCVAMYPSPNEVLNLNQITLLRHRYPGVTIGFSTQEDPNNLTAVKLAYAKGARIFEKHVGLPTSEIKLNAYSAAPEQVEAWIGAWQEAVAACGAEGERVISEQELRDINSLKRGVYVFRAINQGQSLARGDVFFAIPLLPGQLTSGQWKEGLVADRDYAVNEAVDEAILPHGLSKKDIIYSTIHVVKGMLNNQRIPLSHDFMVELSHHYGLERFHEIGCIIIECINREYAKKIIVQLPGQYNPVHYHKSKDESFQILSGLLSIEIDGKQRTLYPGDTLWVPRGVWHGFGTDTGVIFEEISTTSLNDDSFYIDPIIAALPREERKTHLHNWGRHQFN
ncbi:MAG: cupin domain-containing protein [Candidatus Magasanikbacteria bacterium]|nr:cupin domain-containing protein [Candidatus Magasanikbacteria bacterium]